MNTYYKKEDIKKSRDIGCEVEKDTGEKSIDVLYSEVRIKGRAPPPSIFTIKAYGVAQRLSSCELLSAYHIRK